MSRVQKFLLRGSGLERIGVEVARLAAQSEPSTHLALLSYEEAYQREDVQPILAGGYHWHRMLPWGSIS
jgi:hypothetical protein